MEFRHAVLLKLDRELEILRAKRGVLEKLPVGFDAFRADYDRLYGKGAAPGSGSEDGSEADNEVGEIAEQ